MPQDFLNIQQRNGLYVNIDVSKITQIADANGTPAIDGSVPAAGSNIFLEGGVRIETEYASSDITAYLVAEQLANPIFVFSPPQ